MHPGFVVLEPPISNQSPGPNLASWRSIVEKEAKLHWWTKPLLLGNLKAIIINFHAGNRPSVDVDNMSKPILDVLQSIVYRDDRQIIQAEITLARIEAAFAVARASKILVSALQAANQFVYVRIDDPVDPFPLPT